MTSKHPSGPRHHVNAAVKLERCERIITLLTDELVRLKEVVADVDADSIDAVLKAAERLK